MSNLTRDITRRPALVAGRCSFLAIALTGLLTGALAQQPPANKRQVGPGLQIDWKEPAVEVQATVVLREGPLEFFACWPGKEHESILRLDCNPTDLYNALGLIGLEAGHPPRWNEAKQRYEPPAGDLVDVLVRTDPRKKWRSAFSWLRERRYGKTPLPWPWVFAGSYVDPQGNRASARTGAGIALVDFPDSMLALDVRRDSVDATLWCSAASDRIPPADTKVTLRIKPARVPHFDALLDERGDLRLNDQPIQTTELAARVRIARRMQPDFALEITARNRLRADLTRLERELRATGLPEGAWRIVAAPPKSAQPK